MIAVAIDHATYHADVAAALEERNRLPKLPPRVVVPSESLATAARNDLAEAGWTDPDIVVWPEAIAILRKHLKEHPRG